MKKENLLPKACRENLVVQDADKELLIYDMDRQKAFCLNHASKLILEQCDGKTTFEQAAANIGKKLKTQVDDQIFWMALGQLKRNGLLDESAPMPNIPKVSRRDLVMSSMALGISLPAVFALSVAPPTGSLGQCSTAGQVCMGDGGAPGTCCDQQGISCTTPANNTGTCCRILFITCTPGPNAFCCPGTGCGAISGVPQCCVTTNPCNNGGPNNGACCDGTFCNNSNQCEPIPV